MFKDILQYIGVTARRVQLVGEKIFAGKMDVTDQRGGQWKSLDKEKWTEKIIAHIQSFPADESHYAQSKTTNKLFLSPELNVSQMYRTFLEKYCQ